MKAIIILSGGLDSTVLLADRLSRGHAVKALTVDYGQRHRRELEAARAVAAHYGVEHRVADLRSITPLLAGSSQTDASVPVPHGSYDEESMRATIVPNRNMIMLSVAVGWAISSHFDHVLYGAHAGDHAVYPDCRESFVTALSGAAQLADWKPVWIAAPWATWSKAEVAHHGVALKVPFELTWTCYEGGEVACGKCGTCVERLEAFDVYGHTDPLTYADREFWRAAVAGAH